MQRKQAIIAGLLAGTAAIGAIAFTQRSQGPADPAGAPATTPTATIAPNGAAPALAEGAVPLVTPAGDGTDIDTLMARLGESTEEIARLRSDLAARDARIAELTTAIAEREARLVTLETEAAALRNGDLAAALVERDARIEDLAATVAERTAAIERIRAEMEAMVVAGDLAVAERGERIEVLTGTLAERDATIAKLQAEMETLRAGGDLGPALAERDTRIDALSGDLEAREAAITSLQAELEALRGDSAALDERDRRIAELTATLAEREVAGNALRAELEALREGADLGPALAAQEAAADRRVAMLNAALAERDAVIDRLQNDIEALRRGTDLAPMLAAAGATPDKPVLAFADPAGDAARLDAMLDTLKLEPAITIPLANPAPGLRLAAALRPAGDTPTLAEVHFELGSARLSPGAQARAAAAVVVLGDMPITRLRLIGFADRTGSPAFNQRLAEERAAAVAAFLVANGLSPDVIETAGVIDAAELPVQTGPGVSEPLNRSVAIVPLPAPTS